MAMDKLFFGFSFLHTVFDCHWNENTLSQRVCGGIVSDFWNYIFSLHRTNFSGVCVFTCLFFMFVCYPRFMYRYNAVIMCVDCYMENLAYIFVARIAYCLIVFYVQILVYNIQLCHDYYVLFFVLWNFFPLLVV